MAYTILIRNLLRGESFTMYGDGEQTRSNTFVEDCVRGTMLAMTRRDKAEGEVFNIGGGEIVSLNHVIGLLEELTGATAAVERAPARPGDQKHTAADITKARERLGYTPTTPVREGLEAQVAWVRSTLENL
jgi:UDP-glucose 4-epimerase